MRDGRVIKIFNGRSWLELKALDTVCYCHGSSGFGPIDWGPWNDRGSNCSCCNYQRNWPRPGARNHWNLWRIILVHIRVVGKLIDIPIVFLPVLNGRPIFKLKVQWNLTTSIKLNSIIGQGILVSILLINLWKLLMGYLLTTCSFMPFSHVTFTKSQGSEKSKMFWLQRWPSPLYVLQFFQLSNSSTKRKANRNYGLFDEHFWSIPCKRGRGRWLRVVVPNWPAHILWNWLPPFSECKCHFFHRCSRLSLPNCHFLHH